MRTALSTYPLARRTGLLLCAMAISGCTDSEPWDQEFTCQGHERATLQLQAHPESENYDKQYAIAVDFHIRADTALVKSHQVRLSATADGQLHFSERSAAGWVAGSFDTRTGALSLLEARTMVVDGTPQESRTTGQYRCLAIGTVRTV